MDKNNKQVEELEQLEELEPTNNDLVVEENNKNEEKLEKTVEKTNVSKQINVPKINNILELEKSKLTIIAIALVVLLTSIISVVVNSFSKKEVPKKVIKVESEEKANYTLKGNQLQDFDISFLKLENNETNMIYSPLSIKYALEMLKEGTAGESKKQLETILGDYQPKKYMNNANMSFANAMFINQLYKTQVKDEYTKALVDKYYAEVIYDSFETSGNINKWVSDKTFGLINNILPEGEQTNKKFYLINALAIDMEWNNKIQADTLGKNNFHVNYKHEKYSHYISPTSKDTAKEILFDNGKLKAHALEIGASINKYDIVKKLGEDNIRETITSEYNKYLTTNPCGGIPQKETKVFVEEYIKELNSNYNQIASSTDFEFYVDTETKVFAKDLKTYEGTTLQYIGIMPTNESLAKYIERTKAKDYNKLIKNLNKVELDSFNEGVVTQIIGNIPTFNFDYQLDLESDLKKLNVTDIFDEEKADLTGIMKKGDNYISDALHKANINFSNDGIKAAAVTLLGGAGSMGCGFEYLYEVPVEIIDLTFDKPYLFFIRDKNTNEIWFTGTVYEPNKTIR